MRFRFSKSLLWTLAWSASVAIGNFACAENVVSETSGSSDNRLDVSIVGDGYTADQLPIYHQHLDDALAYIFDGPEEPFNRYKNFFNFHRIEVISNESGTDYPDPEVLPSEHYRVDTALNSQFFFDGFTERLLSVDQTLALEVEARSLPTEVDVDLRVSTINTIGYGGAGGDPFGTEKFYVAFAGGNPAAFEIALHEIGHPLGNLADEYVSFESPFVTGEPTEVNVTTDPTGAKWERWIGYQQEVLGPIGVFEGGRYYATDIYRPSARSKMQQLGLPFDAVARESIVLGIYEHVTPIDSHTPQSETLTFSQSVNVQVVDPEVISIDWLLTGNQVQLSDLEASGEFPMRQLVEQGILPGSYVLTAIASDKTDWIRLEAERPREVAVWPLEYYPGDYNGNQRTDVEDIDLLTAEVAEDAADLDFDLNQDLTVDNADRELWVAANQTLFGDADLDRDVDFADFLLLSESFGEESATSWGQGNFDGIGGVGFADFLYLSRSFGQSTAALQAVPEPSSLLSSLLSSVALAMLLRRRRQVS